MIKGKTILQTAFSSLKDAAVLALLVSVMWLFTNSLVNRHSHRLPSGIIVEHAHPFSSNRTPVQQHSHTDKEYFYFDQISALQTLIIIAIMIFMATVYIRPLKIEKENDDILLIINPVYRLRPPPFF
jgi:4-amino-4-deoxy-L-arabinose transferase-like glycosyltransferase